MYSHGLAANRLRRSHRQNCCRCCEELKVVVHWTPFTAPIRTVARYSDTPSLRDVLSVILPVICAAHWQSPSTYISRPSPIRRRLLSCSVRLTAAAGRAAGGARGGGRRGAAGGPAS